VNVPPGRQRRTLIEPADRREHLKLRVLFRSGKVMMVNFDRKSRAVRALRVLARLRIGALHPALAAVKGAFAFVRSTSLLEIRPVTGTSFKLGASPKRMLAPT